MGNAAVTLLLLLCLICWNLLPIDSELWTVAYKCTADVREMLSDWKSVGNRLENFQCSMGHSFPEIEKEKTIPPCLPEGTEKVVKCKSLTQYICCFYNSHHNILY